MSLSVSLSIAISTDRESMVITDNTVYGTGGNPARNVLKLYFQGFKVDIDNVGTDLTIDSYDPATVTEWTSNYSIDGFYKFYYAAIPAYSALTTYAQYDAVYNGSTVYRSLVGSNTGHDTSNTSYWEVISSPATLANNKGESNESLNINTLVYLRVLSADSQYAYGNMISDGSVCTDCDQRELLLNYDLFSMWIAGMAIADAREEVLDGETIARKVQSRFIDCVQ